MDKITFIEIETPYGTTHEHAIIEHPDGSLPQC
jgi:hypothetical protein